jgi:hypothetical protein
MFADRGPNVAGLGPGELFVVPVGSEHQPVVSDRKMCHRHAALQLATAVLIVGRLIDYLNRWSPT